MSISPKPASSDLQEALHLIEECKKTGSTHLRLAHLNLTSLPEEVCELNELCQLDVNQTHISAIPSWIAELSNLEMLQWFDNGPLTIPDGLDRSQLRYVNISAREPIKGIEQLSKLKSLSDLTLQSLTFTAIQDACRELRQVKTMRLHRAKLTDLPAWVSTSLGPRLIANRRCIKP